MNGYISSEKLTRSCHIPSSTCVKEPFSEVTNIPTRELISGQLHLGNGASARLPLLFPVAWDSHQALQATVSECSYKAKLGPHLSISIYLRYCIDNCSGLERKVFRFRAYRQPPRTELACRNNGAPPKYHEYLRRNIVQRGQKSFRVEAVQHIQVQTVQQANIARRLFEASRRFRRSERLGTSSAKRSSDPPHP